VRLFQWGLVQWYAFVMVSGIVGLSLYYFVPPEAWHWVRSRWYVLLAVIILLSFLTWIISRQRWFQSRLAESKR
jgi:tellurite resistance protein TehA-like permease